MKRFALMCLLVSALSLVGSMTLSAEQGKGKGKGSTEKSQGKPQETKVTVVFSDPLRESARSYFVTQHGRGNCPPGLAKKDNGCLPPGQAKKRYVVGHSLPSGIVVGELPVELSVRIGPAPAGYRYGILDGDLLKLAVGTMLVADAIVGLVR